jgi:hypothetical protein
VADPPPKLDFSPGAGRKVGLWLRHVVIGFLNLPPDPPGQAIGGRVTVQPRPEPSPAAGGFAHKPEEPRG